MTNPKPAHDAKRRRRRKINIIACFAVLIVIIILTVLEYFWLEKTSPAILALLNFNAILLMLLLVLIFRNLIKLFVEQSRHKAGTRFRTKLVLAFTILTLVPTIFLALIGTNLMANAIQNWFDPQVNQFVDDSMEIARMAHRNFEDLAVRMAGIIAERLAETGTAGGSDYRNDSGICRDAAESLRDEFSLDAIQIFDADNTELCRAAVANLPSGIFATPADIERTGLDVSGEFIQLVPMGSDELIKSGQLIWSPDDRAVLGAVVIHMRISGPLAARIRNIQASYDTYKQQKQSIRPSQGLYVSIFLLISLTVLFAALWVSLYFARQISEPLSHLSNATLELARGNYDVRLDIQALDEFGDLVRSFNSMTDELRANRDIIQKTTATLQERNREIDARRNELEVILSTIKAGVIALDVDGCTRVINAAACGFLGVESKRVLQEHYFRGFGLRHLRPVVDILDRVYLDKYKVFQNEIQLESGSRFSTYAINVTPLVSGTGDFNGVVIVLNDLTHLLRIQRIAAWREVARRLAHEIKNPLTPIQLNTQRMQRKFQESSDDFPSVFEACTTSIINEVQGLRQLLDEFSRFARMPEASLQPGNLNDIVAQATELYSGKAGIIIQLSLNDIIPDVMLDASQMKRVLINLIDNAIEAMDGRGTIDIRTSYDAVIDKVRLEVGDNGRGVPDRDKNKLFLPYFSTKGGGSGLGLAICSRIVTDHEGSIRLTDNHPTGARFVIELPPVVSV
ncbi:MAG TPA: ATP-binding protein [bacterium]|nr:ATP-binding protein [bacterium]